MKKVEKKKEPRPITYQDVGNFFKACLGLLFLVFAFLGAIVSVSSFFFGYGMYSKQEIADQNYEANIRNYREGIERGFEIANKTGKVVCKRELTGFVGYSYWK